MLGALIDAVASAREGRESGRGGRDQGIRWKGLRRSGESRHRNIGSPCMSTSIVRLTSDMRGPRIGRRMGVCRGERTAGNRRWIPALRGGSLPLGRSPLQAWSLRKFGTWSKQASQALMNQGSTTAMCDTGGRPGPRAHTHLGILAKVRIPTTQHHSRGALIHQGQQTFRRPNDRFTQGHPRL